ncbi:MAG: DegV family EDD domain-containing protein [Lachnospiraceae bacterium]|nr:DegV family EDD domain-containing protein [Lachnospiraceae bacterium]
MKRLKTLYEELFINPERDFTERSFVMLTMIAMIAIFLILVADVVTGENMIECLALFVMLFCSPFIISYSVKNKRIQFGAGLISVGIVYVILPITFFFGGGLTGGSMVWISFSYLFIGLILVGALKTVMLLSLTVLVFAEFLIAYLHPELIVEHDRKMWFLDTGISVLLVGLVVYIMVWFQSRLFMLENTRAKEQAEEIDELSRAQNRFFSSMSHEIRTPINTIIGLNEMILREDVSEEVAEDARSIKSASNILLSLINDILDMSKIRSGRMDIVHLPYDVGVMLSELVNMIWIKAEEKGLQFSVDVDPEIPSGLVSDEVRIKQILINLLNNAVKYTQEGSVTLSIRCLKKGNGKALVSYSVEDTGMGIRKESIPHLFDEFRREDENRNRYIEGTGLGLSIVKQLTDLLGGQITVNSVYTKGSTFEVTIEQDIAVDQALGDYDPNRFHLPDDKKRYHQSFEAPDAEVLIVDDNNANLMVAVKLLRETKVRTDTALSGKECLKLTLQKHYNAILMDHMMPEMDGIECLHAIREQSGGLCKDTPVIALTANAGSENKALYRKEGFDGYLLKPVEAEMLEETLRAVLPSDLVSGVSQDDSYLASEGFIGRTREKIPLLVTTDSVSDLPQELLRKYNIPVMPYKVYTKGGVFSDGIEAGGDVIVRYLADKGSEARSEAPSVEEYEEFFARLLSKAQHILHIAMAKNASKGYENAAKAASAFYNVTVFDSGHLSSGMGIMAVEAVKLADSDRIDLDYIKDRLEKKKSRVRTSFIVDSTEYLYRSGRLSERVYKLCNAFLLHPRIIMKNSSMKVGSILIGERQRVCSSYINKALHDSESIDKTALFITYVGMKREEIEKVKDDVLKVVDFEKVYMQKASPAVSINSGPGTFGLIFSRK